MPRLIRKRRQRRRVPVGDLDTRIFVEDRVQAVPAFGFTDATLDFTEHPEAKMIWAKVETSSGNTFFDGVETDRSITHEVTFRHLDGITPETWLRLQDGTRLDILNIEPWDARGEFQFALCEATGVSTRAAASR